MDDGGERRVLEDIVITPFFDRHANHMPVSLSLHAEIEDKDDKVILRMKHPGLSEGEVKVEAEANTIKVRMCFDDCPDSYFNNTYVTPVPIDRESIIVDHVDDSLVVTALKIVDEED